MFSRQHMHCRSTRTIVLHPTVKVKHCCPWAHVWESGSEGGGGSPRHALRQGNMGNIACLRKSPISHNQKFSQGCKVDVPLGNTLQTDGQGIRSHSPAPIWQVTHSRNPLTFVCVAGALMRSSSYNSVRVAAMCPRPYRGHTQQCVGSGTTSHQQSTAAQQESAPSHNTP